MTRKQLQTTDMHSPPGHGSITRQIPSIAALSQRSTVQVAKLCTMSLVLMVLVSTAAASGGSQGAEVRSGTLLTAKRRWCGERLMDMVKKTCNNCFRDPEEMLGGFKRANKNFWNRPRISQNNGPNQFDGINRRTGLIHAAQAKRDGIVEKCCESTCTYADLMSYCCKEMRDTFG